MTTYPQPKLLIGGEWIAQGGDGSMAVHNPATELAIAQRSLPTSLMLRLLPRTKRFRNGPVRQVQSDTRSSRAHRNCYANGLKELHVS